MFKVDSGAVREAAARFARSAKHLAVAAKYHQAPSRIEFLDQGLIRKLKDSHEQFASLLQARLDQASAAVGESATELEKVATYYGQTDAAAAARVDATLPEVERSDRNPWRGR